MAAAMHFDFKQVQLGRRYSTKRKIKDGKLEMIEYAGTAGHNFKVMLNGRLIGAIMDNMAITIRNVIWDNAFLIVYDKEYLPLITAVAVMVTRELAREMMKAA